MSNIKHKNKKNNSIKKRSSLGAIFDKHIKCEFQDHDVDATMKTMVKEPYVHHVPVLTGGVGYDEVYNFYKTHFVGKMPDDHPFYFNSMSDETKREEIRSCICFPTLIGIASYKQRNHSK